mgnify:CR=1 FL=1
MNGYIVKGIGGFYYVKTPDGIVECKPRGIFRKQKITPVAGDEVTLETENGASVIAQIAPRKNVFVRPPVANLDVLFLVASTTQPTPSTLVLDKLSARALAEGMFATADECSDYAASAANCAYELTFLLAGIVCFVYVVLIRKQKLIARQEAPKYAGAAFETAGQFAYIFALSDTAHVAISAPIISAYCVASVVWSRIFLKEKLSLKHYLMIALVVAGIVILGVYDA